MMARADQQDNSHIEKMHDSEGEQDPTSHTAYTACHFSPGMHCFPETDHQGCITEVEQVITGEQYPVDRIGKFLIIVKEAKNIYPAIAIKNKTGMNSDEVSDEQVNEVSESIHNRGFGCCYSFTSQK